MVTLDQAADAANGAGAIIDTIEELAGDHAICRALAGIPGRDACFGGAADIYRTGVGGIVTGTVAPIRKVAFHTGSTHRTFFVCLTSVGRIDDPDRVAIEADRAIKIGLATRSAILVTLLTKGIIGIGINHTFAVFSAGGVGCGAVAGLAVRSQFFVIGIDTDMGRGAALHEIT